MYLEVYHSHSCPHLPECHNTYQFLGFPFSVSLHKYKQLQIDNHISPCSLYKKKKVYLAFST